MLGIELHSLFQLLQRPKQEDSLIWIHYHLWQYSDSSPYPSLPCHNFIRDLSGDWYLGAILISIPSDTQMTYFLSELLTLVPLVDSKPYFLSFASNWIPACFLYFSITAITILSKLSSFFTWAVEAGCYWFPLSTFVLANPWLVGWQDVAVWLRLALNSQVSFLGLLSARIIGICHFFLIFMEAL